MQIFAKRDPPAGLLEGFGALLGQPEQLGRPIAGMQDAAGAPMHFDDVDALTQPLDLRGAASVEQMNDWGGGSAVCVRAKKAVPEQGKRYTGRPDALLLELIMQVIEALAAEIQQLIGVHFDASIVSSGWLVGDLLTVVELLDAILIEEEGTHRRGANIEADDVGQHSL